MALIVNIRGANGAGKSWCVHQLIARLGVERPLVRDGKVIGYELRGGVWVVGAYENPPAGGCDSLEGNEICRRVKSFADKGARVVVFEGLVASTVYGRYHALSRELRAAGHQYAWLFLNTSLEKCIAQTLHRRRVRGDDRPLNPARTTAKHKASGSILKLARADGENAFIVDQRGVVDFVLEAAEQETPPVAAEIEGRAMIPKRDYKDLRLLGGTKREPSKLVSYDRHKRWQVMLRGHLYSYWFTSIAAALRFAKAAAEAGKDAAALYYAYGYTERCALDCADKAEHFHYPPDLDGKEGDKLMRRAASWLDEDTK